jgi:hypothetical protein
VPVIWRGENVMKVQENNFGMKILLNRVGEGVIEV